MTKTATIETHEIDFTTASPVTEAQVPATFNPHQAPAIQPLEPATILQVIARVASDPAADIEKMERLIAMQERMEGRQQQTAYDRSMSDAQEEMQPIRANMENPQTRSEYADQAALDRAIRPIYTRHGFSLSFSMGDGAPAEHVRIVCTVACHGHREYPYIDMPSDGKGARGGDVMTKTHATGAAATYGKRYLLGMIFNLAVARDDDGNGAGGSGKADDVESLAPANAPRDANGKLLSTYNAEKARKAQDWADGAIEYLNLSNAMAAKEWCRVNWTVPKGKRKSDLQILKDSSLGQYTRVRQTYQNVTGEDLE